jgi:small subunit ribosomal protein S2
MAKPTYQEMLDAGTHFGHMRRKWNPKMAPYIFMERKGIHIIDLNRTSECLDRAANAMRAIAKSGKKILFVATKKQARDIVSQAAAAVDMPFVTERWLGGMLTNFSTIKRSVKKMQNIERMLADGTATNMTKKERLTLDRERQKLGKVLGGVEQLGRLPAAIFVVDILHEHIAISEARRLGIRTFAMVDTNSDPNQVDFPIPANDDASKSIAVITNYLAEAVREGLEERKQQSKPEEKEAAV